MRHIAFGPTPEHVLLRLDLGEPNDRYYDRGDLDDTAGNLNIYVDGKEWGSLYFFAPHNKPTISLGQYDPWTEDWQDRNPIAGPAQLKRDPALEKLITAAAWYWDASEQLDERILGAQASLIDEAVPDRPTHQNFEWIKLQIRNRAKDPGQSQASH